VSWCGCENWARHETTRDARHEGGEEEELIESCEREARGGEIPVGVLLVGVASYHYRSQDAIERVSPKDSCNSTLGEREHETNASESFVA